MRELDEVRLKDGRTGVVLEVLGGGREYLVEFATPGGEHEYDQEFVEASEVEPAEDQH